MIRSLRLGRGNDNESVDVSPPLSQHAVVLQEPSSEQRSNDGDVLLMQWILSGCASFVLCEPISQSRWLAYQGDDVDRQRKPAECVDVFLTVGAVRLGEPFVPGRAVWAALRLSRTRG